MNLDLGPGYLPAFIAEEVLPSAPVRPAEGIHDYLFTLARVLHPWRTEEQISGALHAYARQCGRHVPETEIAASIRRAKAHAWNGQTHSTGGGGTYVAQPAAPPPRNRNSAWKPSSALSPALITSVPNGWPRARRFARGTERLQASFMQFTGQARR